MLAGASETAVEIAIALGAAPDMAGCERGRRGCPRTSLGDSGPARRLGVRPWASVPCGAGRETVCRRRVVNG